MSETEFVEREGVLLRPVDEDDLAALLRFRWDPATAGEYQWFGFRIDDARAGIVDIVDRNQRALFVAENALERSLCRRSA